MQLSVIICTHNPRTDYLRRTLEALKAQTLPKEQWELLLIDNASTDRLAEIWDLSWHQQARHIREDELGTAAARLRGFREFRAPLLVFVDDDNVLDSAYLEDTLEIAARYPYLGAFGAGVIEPEFEIEPPRELIQHLSRLALRKVSRPQWGNNPRDGACLPYGAGMCLTRAVAERSLQIAGRMNAAQLLGQRGQQLFRHEDDLFCWAAAQSGAGFGVFPELRIQHLISSSRLNQGYFLRLIHGSAVSHCLLNYLLAGERPQRLGFMGFIHFVLHGMRNGIFSMRCQWASVQGEVVAQRLIFERELQPVFVNP